MQQYMSFMHKYLSSSGHSVTEITGNDSSFDSVSLSVPENESDAMLHVYPYMNNIRLCAGSAYFDVIDGSTHAQICEAVISAVRFYDEWEHKLFAAAWSNEGYVRMVEIADSVFKNPIFLCNWQGSVYGYSKAFRDSDFSSTWHMITHENRVPLSSLEMLLKSQFRSSIYIENSVHLLVFPEQDFRSIFGLIHVDHEIVLQFQIMEYARPLCEADIKLSRIFLDALKITFREISMSQLGSSMDVFRDLLNRRSTSTENVNWALDYLGWKDSTDAFHVIAFDMGESSKEKADAVSQLEYNVPSCKVLDWNGRTVMLAPAQAIKQFKQPLIYACRMMGVRCSVSLGFCDWTQLRDYYDQAVFCLSLKGAAEPVCFCPDHIWELFTWNFSRAGSAEMLIHPAISHLRDYDKKHRTSYAKTLYTYLICERSTSSAADAMFIHRNTLQYRITRIQELIPLDLEDPSVRMHIILSYILTDSITV